MCLYDNWLILDYAQADGEQPSTSRSLDDDDEPDDLSEPLSSTGTDRPGLNTNDFLNCWISMDFDDWFSTQKSYLNRSIVRIRFHQGLHFWYFGFDDITFVQVIPKLSICDTGLVEGKESIETGERFWSRSSYWSRSRVGTTSSSPSHARVSFYCI